MRIKITREKLKKLGACDDALHWFDSNYPLGVYESKWTKKEQLRLLQTNVNQWFSWLEQVNLVPFWSMDKVDLCDADLSYSDLFGLSFAVANFRKAILRSATWHFLKLFEADFTDSTLDSAVLDNCDAFAANFDKASLHGAELSHCNLGEASFHKADLGKCTFRNCYLSGTDFNNAVLLDTDFDGCIRSRFDDPIPGHHVVCPEGINIGVLVKDY